MVSGRQALLTLQLAAAVGTALADREPRRRRLVHASAAVFLDVGRCWFADDPVGPDTGVLKDAGLGLRISSSRSGRGNMIHLDVAIPFDGDPSISSLQWLVSTKETF